MQAAGVTDPFVSGQGKSRVARERDGQGCWGGAIKLRTRFWAQVFVELRFHSFDDGFCSALPGDRNHARIFVRCSHRRVWNGGLQVFPCYLDVFAARGIDQSMTKYYSDFCMHICSRNSGMSKAKAVKCFIAALNKVLRGCWTTPHNLGHYDTWT